MGTPAVSDRIHHTVGVYPNGEYKQNGVTHGLLKGHIDYNKVFRPGRALFVDGKCVHRGALSDEVLEKATAMVATLTPPTRDTHMYR